MTKLLRIMVAALTLAIAATPSHLAAAPGTTADRPSKPDGSGLDPHGGSGHHRN